jgi:hypothetical protein
MKSEEADKKAKQLVQQAFYESSYESIVKVGMSLNLSPQEVGDILCWMVAQFMVDFIKPGHEEAILQGIADEIKRRQVLIECEGSA